MNDDTSNKPSGDDPRADPNFSTNWDPEAWMPERAALRKKFGPERHLHFPPHLLPRISNRHQEVPEL